MDKSQIISLLENMGIDTNNINLDKMLKMISKIKDPSNIDPTLLSEITDSLTNNKQNKPINKTINKPIKIRRNEKCPCDSGKKWKNCCI